MTDRDENEKVALVTGASSGIGAATAQRLLADGYVVYVAARRREKMRDLEQLGAVALAMDITREADAAGVVERIERDHGGVDFLINNAGFGMFGAMEDTTLADARYQFEVNFFGLARLTQLVLPRMRRQCCGRIVNMSSMGGRIYTPLGSWYHATKHALEGWSDCLRIELAPFGIDVVIVEPGIIRTEFGEVLMEPMLQRSGESAYADMAHKVARGARELYAAGAGSPPAVIADVVSRALAARRPRTRYVAGKMARRLMFVRKWLGDRAFDRVLASRL